MRKETEWKKAYLRRMGNRAMWLYLGRVKENIPTVQSTEPKALVVWEGTFRNFRELLSGLVFTNTTQILQACKQMQCDNNEH